MPRCCRLILLAGVRDEINDVAQLDHSRWLVWGILKLEFEVCLGAPRCLAKWHTFSLLGCIALAAYLPDMSLLAALLVWSKG